LVLNAVRDVRSAIRQLRSSPGFSASAIATIALAIGANTAMFSFVNGLLLTPLPYPESDRIVRLGHHAVDNGADAGNHYRHLLWNSRTTRDDRQSIRGLDERAGDD
jgi:putative ABC transport system permease protein